jgi:hypothetical protein
MYALLAPEEFNGLHSYFAFKSLSVTGQCLVSTSIPDPKLVVAEMGPKTQNYDILKNSGNNLLYVSEMY